MYSQKGSKTPLFVVGVLMVAVLLMAACGRGRMAPQRAPADTATTTAAEPAATTAMTATAVMTEATAMTETSAMTEATVMTETSAMTEATVMTETSAMTEATTTDATALVAVMDDPTLGKILVDGKGMTLYMFDNDSSGKSTCDGDCLKNWPALTVADEKAVITPGAGVTGDWAVITRDDGTYQVTVNGMPLYTYAKDTKAGDVVGQAVGDGWWVVSADGKKIDKQ
jgi:predicted lipoprotein with Yx(FWY)xxD motif